MTFAILPLDDTAIDGVLELQAAARAVDTPDFPPPCRHDLTGLVGHPVSAVRREFRVAWDGDKVAGYLQLDLPLRDNVDNCEVALEVHPAYRRRGIGRALYSYSLDFLREIGRKRIAGASHEGAHCMAFGAAMGASPALVEVRRRLDLSTVDESGLAALLESAWRRAEGYRLVQWRDRVPEEYAPDVGYLDARLVTDAPQGDLVWEPEKIDTARIREGEAARAARGIRSYSTGVVDEASGRLVALTALGMNSSTDWHAYQWITIVDPDHRGHRLGTVVKLENLAQARRAEPALRAIDTWNADVNDHMISINEAMGFRAADRWTFWQQPL